MIKLLNAGFTRLRKSILFWLLFIFSIGTALFMICINYYDMKKYGDVIELQRIILNYSMSIGIVIAIFTSLFIGIEYSDGAIRNKISIGHKRINIYLSNLILVSIISIFSYILFIIVVSIIGIPLFGGITISFFTLLKSICCIFLLIISFSSIFTFIAMLISNKTVTAIIAIMLAFGLRLGALVCLKVVTTHEYINTSVIVDGEVKLEKVKNPNYPSETKKKLFKTLLDINPAGQGFELLGGTETNLKVLPLYSLTCTALFTSIGVILFKKKELK